METRLHVGCPCPPMKSSHLPWHLEAEKGYFRAFLIALKFPNVQIALRRRMEMESDQLSHSGHSLAKVRANVTAMNEKVAEVREYVAGSGA